MPHITAIAIYKLTPSSPQNPPTPTSPRKKNKNNKTSPLPPSTKIDPVTTNDTEEVDVKESKTSTHAHPQQQQHVMLIPLLLKHYIPPPPVQPNPTPPSSPPPPLSPNTPSLLTLNPISTPAPKSKPKRKKWVNKMNPFKSSFYLNPPPPQTPLDVFNDDKVEDKVEVEFEFDSSLQTQTHSTPPPPPSPIDEDALLKPITLTLLSSPPQNPFQLIVCNSNECKISYFCVPVDNSISIRRDSKSKSKKKKEEKVMPMPISLALSPISSSAKSKGEEEEEESTSSISSTKKTEREFICYTLLSSPEIPDSSITTFLEELHNSIPHVALTSKANTNVQQILKNLCLKYDAIFSGDFSKSDDVYVPEYFVANYSRSTRMNPKIRIINDNLQILHTKMHANIATLLLNQVKVESILVVSDNLNLQSQVFKKQSVRLRKMMWLKNLKWQIIVGGVGVLIVGLVVWWIVKATGN